MHFSSDIGGLTLQLNNLHLEHGQNVAGTISLPQEPSTATQPGTSHVLLSQSILDTVPHVFFNLNKNGLEKIVDIALEAIKKGKPEPNRYTQDLRYEYIKKAKDDKKGTKCGSRTLIIDHEEKTFFILLKSKDAVLPRCGGYKRGSLAVSVATESKKIGLVWQLVTKDERSLNTSKFYFIDKQVLTSCGKHDHLPQLIGAFKYTKIREKEGKEIQSYKKECLIYPYMPNTVQDYIGSHTCTSNYPEIAAIIQGAVSALITLYAHGWIHFDIKPSNILLEYIESHATVPFKVVLNDFDFADQAKKIQIKTRFYGTLQYTPPEMLRRLLHYPHMLSSKLSDMQPQESPKKKMLQILEIEKIDVYALGCILYQLLFGSVPWKDDIIACASFYKMNKSNLCDPNKYLTMLEKINQVINRQENYADRSLASLECLKEKLSGSLDKFLEQACFAMIHPDPEKRPSLKQLSVWFSERPMNCPAEEDSDD